LEIRAIIKPARCDLNPETINCDNYHFCLTNYRELFGIFENVIITTFNTSGL